MHQMTYHVTTWWKFQQSADFFVILHFLPVDSVFVLPRMHQSLDVPEENSSGAGLNGMRTVLYDTEVMLLSDHHNIIHFAWVASKVNGDQSPSFF